LAQDNYHNKIKRMAGKEIRKVGNPLNNQERRKIKEAGTAKESGVEGLCLGLENQKKVHRGAPQGKRKGNDKKIGC